MTYRKYRSIIAAFLTTLSLLTLGTSAVLASPANQDDTGDDQGGFCTDADAQHPVAAKIAEKYGVTYEQVMAWRCEGHFGFGQIVLALETSSLTGKSADELLNQHGEGHGWGQIWKENGLTKNDKDGGPPEWAGHGRPPWAGPEHGKPCWAGVGNGTLPEGCVKPGHGHGNGNGNGNKPCWAGVGNNPLPEGCVKPTDESDQGEDVTETPTP